jgi:SAM-dependent MidA family methyltransferase
MNDTNLVKIINVDIRNKIKFEIPFITGAWFEMYDDISVEDARKLMNYQKTKKTEIETETEFAIRQEKIVEENQKLGKQTAINLISSWNFANENGEKVAINNESFDSLPLKVQKFITNKATEIIKGTHDNHDQVKKN